MIAVVDASVVAELLLRTSSAREIENRLFRGRQALASPELVDVEVSQVLRRYSLSGELSPERGVQAIRDLADLPIERYGHEVLLPRIWELRRNITAYDAVYIALAEALGAIFLTRDGRLARAVEKDLAVELL